MSPLRSSAGPATRADADAELLADDQREARLAEAGRADEQDVVERLAARAVAASSAIASCSLTRSWPTKSASERGRSEPLELVLVLRRSAGTRKAASVTRPPAARAARAPPAAGSGSTARERLLGLDERVPELDERVARDGVLPGGPRPPMGTGSAAASFSFSSSTIRSAVFLPIPGMASKRAASSSTIARRSSAGRRAGDDRERDLRPDAVHARAAGRRARARPASAKP